jgi:hypothetical protein
MTAYECLEHAYRDGFRFFRFMPWFSFIYRIGAPWLVDKPGRWYYVSGIGIAFGETGQRIHFYTEAQI